MVKKITLLAIVGIMSTVSVPAAIAGWTPVKPAIADGAETVAIMPAIAKSVIFLTTLKSSEIYFYIILGATDARKKSI